MTTYNFDELQIRFTTMTFTEILEEYVNILKAIDETEKLVTDSEEFYATREPLENARDFLGQYIALKCCDEHGYKVVQ